MATAGRILIIPRGEYNNNTAYDMLDLVYHKGKSWVAKKAVTGIEPSDANSGYWHKFTDINIANNLTTKEEGYVLDARQGKALVDMITTLEKNVGKTYELKHGVEWVTDNGKEFTGILSEPVVYDPLIGYIDVFNIVVYVNVGGVGVWTDVHIPPTKCPILIPSMRNGYLQTHVTATSPANGGMAAFVMEDGKINLASAYLNGNEVASSTKWFVEYHYTSTV